MAVVARLPTTTVGLVGSGGTMVGSGAIWNDDSDGTYATVKSTTFAGETTEFFDSYAEANIVTDPAIVGTLPSVGMVNVRLRLGVRVAGMYVPYVYLLRSGARTMDTAPTTPVPTTDIGWVNIQIPAMVPSDFQGGGLTWGIGVRGRGRPPGFPGGPSYYWDVYEAEVTVTTSSGDAPPCRIYPRADGLGVGAGRAYPPPKSQQRSPGNRGVGYY